MNNENELLELLKVEELEKRHEMDWIKSAEVSVSADTNGVVTGSAKLNF